MKFALLVLVILPFAMGAPVDEKRSFLGDVFGSGSSLDIVGLAKQLLAQIGTDETEAQCEQTACPQLMENTLHIHNQLIEGLTCGAVCKEVQVLAQSVH